MAHELHAEDRQAIGETLALHGHALLHGLLARENRSSSGLMTAHQIFSRQDAHVPFAMEATMPGGQFRRYP